MKIHPFESPDGVGRSMFEFLMWKRYFDTGYSNIGYARFLIGIFGIASLNVRATLLLGILFGVLCVIIGYFWHKMGFIQADIEISNRLNRFVIEIREKFKSII